MVGSDGWQTYDSVVDAYEEAAVPRFAAVARDLVTAVAPPTVGTVLDIGTGTGLAGEIAREAVGSDGVIVGVDPSVPMLARAVTRGFVVVAGMFPGLPFPDGVFDAVIANLVLSHLSDYQRGLSDAARVLGEGGRFGCTAWAAPVRATDAHQGPAADEIVGSLFASLGIDMTPPTPPVPSEEPLRDRATLEASLWDAGLADVGVQPRTYHWTYSIDEYLLGREWRPGIRYLREQAGARLWREVHGRAAAELRERFGEQIRTMGHMWIAVATKP